MEAILRHYGVRPGGGGLEATTRADVGGADLAEFMHLVDDADERIWLERHAHLLRLSVRDRGAAAAAGAKDTKLSPGGLVFAVVVGIIALILLGVLVCMVACVALALCSAAAAAPRVRLKLTTHTLLAAAAVYVAFFLKL